MPVTPTSSASRSTVRPAGEAVDDIGPSARRRGHESLPLHTGAPQHKEEIMNRRLRAWILGIATAVATGVLLWLPAAAQAGITASGVE